RLGFRRGTGLGLGALPGFFLGTRARVLLGADAGLGLVLGDDLALLAQALLQLGLGGELRLLHDRLLHPGARLLRDLVAQEVFHLLADASLDLFLELGLHVGG